MTDQWYLGQLVRVVAPLRPDRASVVERLTPTLVVLRDGTRWVRRTGRLYAETGVRVTRVEPWGEAHTRASEMARRSA